MVLVKSKHPKQIVKEFSLESYEVILIADGFAPGKILPTAFDELLRVLRPGGYIMWTMADGLAQECPDHFAHFDTRIIDLADQVKCQGQKNILKFLN